MERQYLLFLVLLDQIVLLLQHERYLRKVVYVLTENMPALDGSCGNTDLDSAWRLLSLRLGEREAEDYDFDSYLKDNYGIEEFEHFYAFYDAMMNDVEVDHELICSLSLVFFEFGILYERFKKDMEFLSRSEG
jgi:hypothetical protein